MQQNKIVPSIWFYTHGGDISNILKYYIHIFGQAFQAGAIIPLGETPSGNTQLCEVSIFGCNYLLMATAKEHHALNDAISFILNCEDQEEIDHFWNYFTQEGKAVQCGWCIDRYGLRWQIIPKNLNELMRKPNANQVMMGQQKIIIAEYL